MKINSFPFDKRFIAICLVLGQLLLLITSFFWKDTGRYTLNASVIMFFSMVFWTVGMVGLFGWLRERLAVYSHLGLLYAVYGTFGGVGFAFEGAYSDIFDIADKIGMEAFNLYPVQMNLLLYWSGPAFPLSLLVLGIVLASTKKVSWWVGALLALGGITFPVGRILREEWIALLTDFTLLIPVCMIAFTFWNDNE